MAGVGGLTGDSRGSLLVVFDALCAVPNGSGGLRRERRVAVELVPECLPEQSVRMAATLQVAG
jgi:hypothetical protein